MSSICADHSQSYANLCITYRHCIFASIQSKVMFGAMGVYCMRYGVLDIDHLRK